MTSVTVTTQKVITLTVAEVSSLLGVSTATIYKMVRDGEVPHFKVRGKILFNRDVIEAWTRGEQNGGV
ncbi:helix-turn-helix domain-containing protein [Lysinibacillus macroides]|uniref:Helix-turn-helix domain-containing protein n=1 Tax=Lysinibacillus macroides TaxID=33935 RepID=A0A0M9DIR4_9BACI|nr:helix-turn-helix domain-containing protein [Lysinibacillus macroides]KOY81256.1 hypothetical protein ADM90_19140 [Lysinibacillus macroides]QPR68586.1 helix-turn-helix domain-containing protein [Lysinibacillus macroides]